MKRILIADTPSEWREHLERMLGQQYLLYVCADGQQALELVRQVRPELMILELMLPGADGLSVLKALERCPEKPRIIVTGRYFSEFTSMALEHYRVDSAVMKPCPATLLRDRVAELLAEEALLWPVCPEPGDYIKSLLVRLGVRTSQQGFRFLRSAILRMMDDPTQQLTKILYPAVGVEFGTTKENVEKSLRTAVTCAWRSRRDDVWRFYFPPAPNGQIPKPTAGQFIKRLADVVDSACRKRA